MAGDSIQMTFSEVETLATNLTGAAQQNLDDVNALASKANPEAVWHGTAAQGYQNAFDRWKKAQIEEQNALTALGNAVQVIKDNFERVNQSGTAAFDSFYQ